VVSGVGKSSLRLVRGKGESRRPLGPGLRLFGRASGRPVPLRELELWPNDRVRYRLDAAGRIDYLELDAPVKGVSDDRSARLYSWEARKTRRQLEATVNRRVSVGRLRDLRVVERGVSGRVVALEVVGTKGSTVVRGFDVRRLLDLREILTVIELQRDPAGEIVAAVFAGKGWGHGVGLCQVGAYGMALRGAGYRDILSHYYRGTEVKRAATARPVP
jgi:stage II sporulation protein D